MPTQLPDDWDFHKQPYVEALRNFMALHDPRAQVLLHAAPGNRFKLKVSTLRLQDVVGATGMSAASHVAWRYLAEANGLAVACEMAVDGSRITTLMHGQAAAEQAMKALVALRNKDQTSADKYDLEHLRLGGVHVEAYWLRSKDGANNDQIAPFLMPPKHALDRKPGDSTMAPSYFLDAIKTTAQKHLDFYSGAAKRAAGAEGNGKAKPGNQQTAAVRSRAATAGRRLSRVNTRRNEGTKTTKLSRTR